MAEKTTQIYKRILVAVDFSEHSQKVIERALLVQQQNQAELKLLHTVEIPIYPVLEDIAVMGMPGIWDEKFTEQIITSSKNRLSKLADEFEIEKFEVVAGLAKTDIVEHASRNQFDLIVIGSHGVSGLQHLIGSTANSVINHSKCDVLCVKVKGE